jgi:hypothetical protein
MSERKISNGYIHIGNPEGFIDPLINMDDALALRNSVVDNLLLSPQGMITSLGLTDNGWGTYMHYKGLYNAGTRPINSPDFIHESKLHLAAILHQSSQNHWRLTLQHNRAQRVDGGLSERKMRTLFRVICWGDEVVEASRTVQFAKATPVVLALGKAMSEKTLAAPRFYKRVSFTAPLSPEECPSVTNLIAKHSARVSIEQNATFR